MCVSVLCSSKAEWRQNDMMSGKCFGICKGHIIVSHSKLLTLVLLALHILLLAYLLTLIPSFSSPWPALPL